MPPGVGERSDVLRQAAAAESVTRREIGGGDVELCVALEDVHHLVTVEAESAGDELGVEVASYQSHGTLND